jgi:hypothetical protein
MGLNGLPHGHSALKIGLHGRRQIVQRHGVSLNTLVHAVIEHQDIDASLHPRVLTEQTHLTTVSAVDLYGECIIASVTNGVHDHLSGLGRLVVR